MTEIRRVLIWSGWLRVSHWSVALSTLVLLLSGWLIGNSPMQAEIALEYHYLAVSVLVFGLVLRIAIFLRGKDHERLGALFPEASELRAIRQTLVFYLSLGRQPMPHWYAHNPLWKMIYVFWYVALLLLLGSGVLMADDAVVLGFYLPSVHDFWAGMVFWFTILHLISLFAHDYYAKSTDMSAMINGYRLFEVESQAKDDLKGTPVVLQSMDSLMKGDKNK
ncbi:MAG: cytochrome b/b6 domain-containing protein [Gammaproteobacteria bacterium]|nr:cytochrome b/b6 domain-containing protein [Gammaproteobacteria bacterium]